MRPARLALAAALALAATSATPASAVEVAGARLPDTLTLGGAPLVLNGAGIRTKTFLKVKVYAAALYLPSRSSDGAAVIALDAPKAVRLALLRDIDRQQLLDSIREGMDAAEKGRAARFEKQIMTIDAAMPPQAKAGQSVVVNYVPGQGTTVGIDGGSTTTVPGKDFADALFGVWLGAKVADGGLEDLRDALLGKGG